MKIIKRGNEITVSEVANGKLVKITFIGPSVEDIKKSWPTIFARELRYKGG